ATCSLWLEMWPRIPPLRHREHKGRTARLRPQPNDQVARPVSTESRELRASLEDQAVVSILRFARRYRDSVLTGLALPICLLPSEMSSHKNIVRKVRSCCFTENP